jgi:hypothetical protein
MESGGQEGRRIEFEVSGAQGASDLGYRMDYAPLLELAAGYTETRFLERLACSYFTVPSIKA